MTADLLVEMLREAEIDERARIARRLAMLTEIPPTLARMLLRDRIEVAKELLENSQSLGDCDLALFWAPSFSHFQQRLWCSCSVGFGFDFGRLDSSFTETAFASGGRSRLARFHVRTSRVQE
jgi:hypothetical protein